VSKIVDLYDRIVTDAGIDGLRVAEAIQKASAEVGCDPDLFDVPPVPELVAAYVASVIGGERNTRARNRVVLFQKVHDALTDQTILGPNDPILDLALRTGSRDGLDKALRFWTVEDWLAALGASEDNVDAAIQADRKLRDIVNPIIVAHAARNCAYLADVLAA
jgi:hypothetical protein